MSGTDANAAAQNELRFAISEMATITAEVKKTLMPASHIIDANPVCAQVESTSFWAFI